MEKKGGEEIGKLTEKQKRFIDFYIETGNGAEAARRAGYSEKVARQSAGKILASPRIASAIAARLKEIEDKRIAKAKEVMEFLTSSMRGEIKEEVVVVEGTGDGCSKAKTMEKQIGANDRIKAAVQLAKRYGLDRPEDADGEAHITFKFERGVDDGD